MNPPLTSRTAFFPIPNPGPQPGHDPVWTRTTPALDQGSAVTTRQTGGHDSPPVDAHYQGVRYEMTTKSRAGHELTRAVDTGSQFTPDESFPPRQIRWSWSLLEELVSRLLNRHRCFLHALLVRVEHLTKNGGFFRKRMKKKKKKMDGSAACTRDSSDTFFFRFLFKKHDASWALRMGLLKVCLPV